MSGLCRTLGAAERFLTSSPLQMWKDGFRSRKTQGARCQSGSSESGGSGKKERGGRQRSWATGRVGCRGGATLFLPTPASRASTGVGDGCAFPCLLSSFLGHDFLCMYFLLRFPWCASILSRDRPAEGKGELATCPSPRGQRRRFDPQFELSPRECILSALKEAEEARDDRDKQKWTYKNSAGELVFLRDRFDRIVEGIDKYAKAVDIAVNHSPEITSLVWASARFLLQVSPGFQSPC